MSLLKNILSTVLFFQLLATLVIITQYSLNKMDTINSSLIYKKDIAISDINQKESIKKLLELVQQKRYQQNRYISFFKINSIKLRNTIESISKKFLGRPYVWGASGPNCFDCSGFTQKVYNKIGINLPRVSRSQAKVGRLVYFDELKKGDMVFFDTSKKHKGVVNHVGIYLGDGKFIHASSGSHKVVITSFKKKRFYKNRFLWGRRVIKEKKEYAFNSKLLLSKNTNYRFK